MFTFTGDYIISPEFDGITIWSINDRPKLPVGNDSIIVLSETTQEDHASEHFSRYPFPVMNHTTFTSCNPLSADQFPFTFDVIHGHGHKGHRISLALAPCVEADKTSFKIDVLETYTMEIDCRLPVRLCRQERQSEFPAGATVSTYGRHCIYAIGRSMAPGECECSWRWSRMVVAPLFDRGKEPFDVSVSPTSGRVLYLALAEGSEFKTIVGCKCFGF